MHQRLPHLLQCVEFHNSSFTFAKINSLIAVDFVGGLVHPAFAEQPARIGFLGAGVIFKEGLTVRVLTTAASIWVTAAIGILVGIGFWFAAVVDAVAALIVLALFRYIEARLPSDFYAHHMLRFARDHACHARMLPVPVANQIRTYWWCSPPRTGRQSMLPARSTARETDASFSKDRCVRTSL